MVNNKPLIRRRQGSFRETRLSGADGADSKGSRYGFRRPRGRVFAGLFQPHAIHSTGFSVAWEARARVRGQACAAPTRRAPPHDPRLAGSRGHRSSSSPSPLLPMTMDEARQRGWNEIDVVFITGDAHIDHPERYRNPRSC